MMLLLNESRVHLLPTAHPVSTEQKSGPPLSRYPTTHMGLSVLATFQQQGNSTRSFGVHLCLKSQWQWEKILFYFPNRKMIRLWLLSLLFLDKNKGLKEEVLTFDIVQQLWVRMRCISHCWGGVLFGQVIISFYETAEKKNSSKYHSRQTHFKAADLIEIFIGNMRTTARCKAPESNSMQCILGATAISSADKTVECCWVCVTCMHLLWINLHLTLQCKTILREEN